VAGGGGGERETLRQCLATTNRLLSSFMSANVNPATRLPLLVRMQSLFNGSMAAREGLQWPLHPARPTSEEIYLQRKALALRPLRASDSLG
jgi:hypothetical protein